MNHYIKEIYIKKLRHLSDIKIELNNEHMQHLLLTGKNGSGKTSLLIALAEKLNNICNDIDEKEISDIQNGIEVSFNNKNTLNEVFQNGSFITAFFMADLYFLFSLEDTFVADKKISAAVIKRLPRYYRYLSELLDNGIERISSGELSKQMKVTASQIRQDFNNFGGFGQQGYGYNVPYLKNEIGKILGLDRDYHVIILGAGNLGHALANYAGFEKRGFVVSAVFDVSPDKIGKKIGHTMVYDMKDLEGYVKGHTVDIAALTLPKSIAPAVAKQLVQYGVSAFWNFAATDLNLPGNIAVENVHLAESLMRLSYNISNLPE